MTIFFWIPLLVLNLYFGFYNYGLSKFLTAFSFIAAGLCVAGLVEKLLKMDIKKR